MALFGISNEYQFANVWNSLMPWITSRTSLHAFDQTSTQDGASKAIFRQTNEVYTKSDSYKQLTKEDEASC